MDKRYRYIYFFDLSVKTESTSRQVVNVMQQPIKEIIDKVSTSNPKGRHYSYQKDSLHFYIADWYYDTVSNQYHFLINKSDQNSADPTFSNIAESITRREITKRIGEGLDSSSHVILKFLEDDPYGSILMLERGSVAGAHHLKNLLTRLISDIKIVDTDFFSQNHPDGSLVNGLPKKINLRYSVEVDGYISDSFKDDLVQGVFQDITLINEEVSDDILDSNYVPKRKTQTIILKPNKSFNFDGLKKAVLGQSDSYEKAKVRFKDKNGTEREIEIDTDTFSESDYVKRSKIEAPVSFKSSYATLDPIIISLMKNLR